MQNFLAACRSRNHRDCMRISKLALSPPRWCHLANISYRVGKRLSWDTAKWKFASDNEADALLTRNYRRPYVV